MCLVYVPNPKENTYLDLHQKEESGVQLFMREDHGLGKYTPTLDVLNGRTDVIKLDTIQLQYLCFILLCTINYDYVYY